MTWFVRADGQLESILGSPSYLLENYAEFWTKLRSKGHEIGWHPHLYRQRREEDSPAIIVDSVEAREELERLWEQMKSMFHPTSFRHGEGWHTPETYSTVERLGFHCDSTAIPGRVGSAGHPMNWEHAPNQPYFPSPQNLCQAGGERSMVELPMNTWLLQAPYDAAPRVRYMNPAVHPHLFKTAVAGWERTCQSAGADLRVWVLIFHPDEVLENQGVDALYARSVPDLCRNLTSMTDSLRRFGVDFEWTTVSSAAQLWRIHQQCLIA